MSDNGIKIRGYAEPHPDGRGVCLRLEVGRTSYEVQLTEDFGELRATRPELRHALSASIDLRADEDDMLEGGEVIELFPRLPEAA